MIKNYVKIALRNLNRQKFLALINILGLSLGMTIVLLIAVYVQHEYSYDDFIKDKENTFRVYRFWSETGGNTVWTPSRLAEKLKNDFPEVESSSGLSPGGEWLMEYKGEKMYVDHTVSVDSSFFHTVFLPFSSGDPNTAMVQPNSLVITDRLAKRLFGDANPIGEIIKVDGDRDMQVTAVLALQDKQTHVNYDAFARFTWNSDSWTGNNRATYIHLKPNVSVPDLEEKITATMQELVKQEYLADNYIAKPEDLADWKLQPVKEVHLTASSFNWIGYEGGSMRNINIFMLIGGLVLLVAIVNFVNLATAQATKRAKEVGVRKATGALRTQLMGQFMAESLLQTMLAAMVAIGLSVVLMPVFNTVTGRELQVLGGNVAWGIVQIVGLAVFTGFLAGVYPALVLSGFQPVNTLKTQFVKTGEKGRLRKALITGQFTITIALLILMAFIFRQVNFMMQHDLGFQPDQVMVIPMNQSTSQYKVEELKPVFGSIPGVKEVTTSSRFPGGFFPDWGMLIEDRQESVSPHVIFTDEDYANTIHLELVGGRFFSAAIADDTVDNFVINESFAKAYNLANPVGTRVKFTSADRYGQIIGVVKDFHFQGLQNEIVPLVIGGFYQRWFTGIQLSTANLSNTLFEIEKVWKQVEPEHPIRYTFLDETFAQQYDEQERFGKTMLYATLLTLFIAILGLFGLATFDVERRIKEIGVRKVLGASVASLIGMLSKDFLKLVALAFLIAIPIAWYATNSWLRDFAFRTNLAWWVFALAGLLALLVAFLTISLQSMKAAKANPVESLRSE